ncbi:HNH endonuclease [Streptomyces sp. NPDC096176]|uniref:HNH endonuclease signature motif containing protein n=1 Tax=Streptomyces sp. NPDC096176 TaxID=3366079 RepID=UPI003809CC3D
MPVKYTREQLAEVARDCADWDEAVRRCGGTPTPGRRRYLRQRMAAWGIDTSHFRSGWARHTEERLRQLVAQSSSVRDVLRGLGINPVGGNHAHISRRIATLGIDTSHFVAARRGRPKGSRGDVLTLRDREEGRIPGSRLRQSLVRRGVAEICAMCGVRTAWNNKPLRLEVDHLNGDWWDNRPENLRLLCPNCHAVTDTYRGRKRRGAR